MGALTTTLFVAILLGALVAFMIEAVSRRRGRRNTRTAVVVGLLAGLGIFLFIGISSAFTQVEAGSVAVVKQFGRVVGVFPPGLNFKVPFVQETVPYRTQEILYETSENPANSQADYRDMEVDTATSDGQQISARFTIRFRIDPTKVTDIVNNLGTEAEMVERVVKANSRVHVRNILKQHTATDLYSGNVEQAQLDIANRLEGEFAKEGIQLIFFGLRSIHFEEDYRKAVEQKQIERENITTKENLAKQAEFEKQRTITQAQAEAERQKLERIGEAEGEAEAIRVKAIADAEATRIKAQAQSEANKLISQSLDPNIISWEAIENWSGNYPMVMGGGSFILPADLFKGAPPAPTTGD
jgi:regulator of protease activity HflC (stomatin/prohibitin superfamily)